MLFFFVCFVFSLFDFSQGHCRPQWELGYDGRIAIEWVTGGLCHSSALPQPCHTTWQGKWLSGQPLARLTSPALGFPPQRGTFFLSVPACQSQEGSGCLGWHSCPCDDRGHKLFFLSSPCRGGTDGFLRAGQQRRMGRCYRLTVSLCQVSREADMAKGKRRGLSREREGGVWELCTGFWWWSGGRLGCRRGERRLAQIRHHGAGSWKTFLFSLVRFCRFFSLKSKYCYLDKIPTSSCLFSPTCFWPCVSWH